MRGMISSGRGRRAWRVLAMATVLTLALPSRPFAHEIPPSVTVFAFVKPEANVLRLLVRVPLESIRDFELVLRGPGYLDLPSVNPELQDAARVWIADYVELYENDRPLDRRRVAAARLSLPSDRSFGSYDAALANITGPRLADSTDLPWKQALLDVMIEYQITSPASKFSIRPALAHLGIRTTTVLRFLPPNGSERAFEYLGDPGLVRLDPRWHQAALRFVRLGFEHILDGIDHLLFVFCLVIPFRRMRALIAVVTSFTVAHSITLIASASGLAPDALWFPPLIEVLIALSIVYMAFENIVGAKIERRWIIAFAFGLVHGFGFSFILRRSLQFAGSHLATSLVAFNVGVELGQLFVLAVAIPALALLFKYVVAERIGTILLSALVAHTAWHWMLDRGAALRQYEFQWPAMDAVFAVSVMRALMLVLIVVAAVWALYGLYRRLLAGGGKREPGGTGEEPGEAHLA
jgi:HupE/UreJ protein